MAVRLKILLLSFALVLGGAVAAMAYRLPPEKLTQYWLGRVLTYREFEVRLKHQRFTSGDPAANPDVAEARLLMAGDGRFRLERTDPKAPPLVVVGNAQEVLAVAGGKDLGRSVAARYEFPWLFTPGKAITTDEMQDLRDQYVLLDSGYVLWMLTRFTRWGIPWSRTKLAPYGDGQVGYLMGTTYGDPPVAESEPEPRVLFDNRDFTPVLLEWADEAAGTATEYRTVMSGYGNDMLKNFPGRIQIFVGGELTDDFTLIAARLSPKFTPAEVDLAALRKSLQPDVEQQPASETTPGPAQQKAAPR